MTTPLQPGWYDDPQDPTAQRYWDGQNWMPIRMRKPITGAAQPRVFSAEVPGMPAQPPVTTPPLPDWYPDPSGKRGLMYWDGQQWHTDIPYAPPPAEEFSPQSISTTPRPRRHTALIAAFAVTAVALAGIVGLTGYLLLQHKPVSQIPTAAPSSEPTVQPAPPSSEAVPSATAAPSAEVPGLAPFVGHWGGGHSGGLDIHSDGTGRWTYADISTCPNAPLAGCGITGIAEFRLTSVANGTATGSVTGGSNPKNDPVGEPVTIVLGSANGRGVVLAVSISKMRGWNFCNETSPHWCAEG
jgi:hypothetical protein